MATLTKSTGTVTLSGAVEKVTLPAVYGWVWLKNMSDSDILAGLSADISEGADGVMTIPAGECGRIQTDGFNSIYLMGTGNALVVAQNYADCPFKVGAKGGESPDLSAYAKTADVPNIKVNSAVDADTVGGKSKADFVEAIINNGERFLMMNGDHTTITQIFDSTVPNVPSISNFFHVIGLNSEGNVMVALSVGKDYTRDVYTYSASNAYWKNICEKPYIKGSATVAANSTTCISNHGFTPSAVIWWDGNSSGVAVSFNDTQFVIDKTGSVDRAVYYMIFK